MCVNWLYEPANTKVLIFVVILPPTSIQGAIKIYGVIRIQSVTKILAVT